MPPRSSRKGRTSVRLQSLRDSGSGLPSDKHSDFVRASRRLRPRKWVLKQKRVGGPMGFDIKAWQPLDQPKPTPALQALKDRPAPNVKKIKRRKIVGGLDDGGLFLLSQQQLDEEPALKKLKSSEALQQLPSSSEEDRIGGLGPSAAVG